MRWSAQRLRDPADFCEPPLSALPCAKTTYESHIWRTAFAICEETRSLTGDTAWAATLTCLGDSRTPNLLFRLFLPTPNREKKSAHMPGSYLPYPNHGHCASSTYSTLRANKNHRSIILIGFIVSNYSSSVSVYSSHGNAKAFQATKWNQFLRGMWLLKLSNSS